MKKSKKFVTLFVIVLVLALCASTFAACGAKKITVEKFQASLVDGINGMFPANGYYFGIDAAASYTYKKDKKDKNPVRYDIVIQGTLDTDPNVSSADNQLKVELTETKEGATKTLFGLYYKDKLDQGAAGYEANAPKLFLNINDQYKFAYNTYSIKKMVKDLTPSSKTSDMADIGGFELSAENIVGMILMFMAEEDTFKTKNVKKEVHMSCELNLQKLLDNVISPFLKDDLAEKIDGVLGEIGADITTDTIKGLDLDFPILLTTRYTKVKKGQTPKFLGGSLEIGFDKERPIKISIGGQPIIDTAIPVGIVTVSIDKLAITSDEKVEITTPTEGYILINPINISLDGKLRITNSTTRVTTPYDIILRVDANPIPIAYGVGTWDLKEAVFKSLGTVHFSIISEDRKKAIIDLVYDPKNTGSDSVFATLGLGTLGNITTQFSVSALEGLMSSISEFVANGNADGFYKEKPVTPAGTLSVMSDTEENWLESLSPAIADLLNGGLAQMVNSLGAIIAPDKYNNTDKLVINAGTQETLNKVNTLVQKMITAKDIKLGTIARPTQKNIFLEVNIKKVANGILGSGIINIDDGTLNTINSVLGLVDSALGGDILNIEFTGIGYGTTPHDYNATQFFSANQRSDSNFIKSIDDFNAPSISNKMREGITAAEFMNTIDFNKRMYMKYTNWKGTQSNKQFVPMVISGFDKTATGIQTVTVGFMDIEGHAALGAITGVVGGFLPDKTVMAKIPFGLVRYTFDVNIVAEKA